jgi:putative protease
MKSEYYLATVVNAYRRAIDAYYAFGGSYKDNPLYNEELKKTAHREFTTAYITGDNDRTVNYDDSQSKGTHKFMAQVLDYNQSEGYAVIEMRNRFKTGDILEVLSPNDTLNAQIKVEKLLDEKGNIVEDAKLVQQKLKLFTTVKLHAGDILRKEY